MPCCHICLFTKIIYPASWNFEHYDQYFCCLCEVPVSLPYWKILKKRRQVWHKNLKIKSSIRWKQLPGRVDEIMGLKGEKRNGKKWSFTSRQERLKNLTWREPKTSDSQGSQHNQKKDLSGPRKKAQVCVSSAEQGGETKLWTGEKRCNLPAEKQESISMAKGQ